MDSYYVEVQPVSFKERIKRRGFFIWKISAPLVGAVIMGFYTPVVVYFLCYCFAFRLYISVNLYFFIKGNEILPNIPKVIDSFNKVYLTFDLKGETKMESYELKDFNLLVEENERVILTLQSGL